MADNRKLEEDQLVSRLVPDPAQGPPNTTPLRGYLGRAPAPAGKAKEPVWRLYSSPALNEYVEIPESEIVHSQKLPDEQGTIVWVPKTLPLSHVRVQSSQVQAELLGSGPIAQAQAAGASPAQSVAGGALEPSVATVCTQITCAPSHLCVSRTPCPSVPCPTFTGPCLSNAPSHCTQCPPPSALQSHCTICHPISIQSQCGGVCPPVTLHSHCFVCPTETAVVSRCGGVCEPLTVAITSEVRLCATPTATPSHFRLCPSHLTPCPTVPVTHLPECPVAGPVKIEPEQ